MSAGPCGKLMQPMGTMTFDECYEVYKEMCMAAQNAGADAIVFETMMDLAEARCAVLAAKENTHLPVLVTMTYEDSGRSFLGCDVAAMGMVLEGVGADAVGINCSLGPDRMLPVVQRLAQYTALPLVVKLNAGLPDPQTGEYSLSPEEYLSVRERYLTPPFACMTPAFLSLAYLDGGAVTDDAGFAGLYEHREDLVLFKEWWGDLSLAPAVAAALGAKRFCVRFVEKDGAPFGMGHGLDPNTVFLAALD
jgi:hypothetical protein